MGDELDSFCANMNLSVLNSLFCFGDVTFERSQSVLDLAITNDPSLFSSMTVRPDLPLHSDHFPVVVQLASLQGPPRASNAYWTWNIAAADWGLFSKMLQDYMRVLTERYPDIIRDKTPQAAVNALWAE